MGNGLALLAKLFSSRLLYSSITAVPKPITAVALHLFLFNILNELCQNDFLNALIQYYEFIFTGSLIALSDGFLSVWEPSQQLSLALSETNHAYKVIFGKRKTLIFYTRSFMNKRKVESYKSQ